MPQAALISLGYSLVGATIWYWACFYGPSSSGEALTEARRSSRLGKAPQATADPLFTFPLTNLPTASSRFYARYTSSILSLFEPKWIVLFILG